MQKIVPHLWFDTQAKEATKFYTSVFPDSEILHTSVIHNTPSGDCDVVSFTIAGFTFMAISAGPYFKFNPSVSFHFKCKSVEEVDTIWEKLSDGGTVLMELGEYPFSKRYGWIQDKYGISWQVIFTGEGDMQQRITPVLMFVGEVCGKTEKAITFYASVFKGESQVFARYGKGEEPDKEGTVKYSQFILEGEGFGAMDSARMHDFTFNEAISFMVYCRDQEEIDYYWEKLSSVPEAEQCGWLKDTFGFSWQIVSKDMDEMMRKGTPEQQTRVTEAFLKMKKFDLAELQKAYEGK